MGDVDAGEGHDGPVDVEQVDDLVLLARFDVGGADDESTSVTAEVALRGLRPC